MIVATCRCGAPAVWHYMPMTTRSDVDFCEEHVPRGCSCNINVDGVEDTDELGRLLPCVEYLWCGPTEDQDTHVQSETKET